MHWARSWTDAKVPSGTSSIPSGSWALVAPQQTPLVTPDGSVGSREPGSPAPRIQDDIGGSLRPALASQDRPNPSALGVKSKVQGVPGSGVIWSEAKTSPDVRPAAPRW